MIDRMGMDFDRWIRFAQTNFPVENVPVADLREMFNEAWAMGEQAGEARAWFEIHQKEIEQE